MLKLNNDQRIGVEIVRNSFTAPIKQLISNAGFDSSIIIIEKTIRRMVIYEKYTVYVRNMIHKVVSTFIRPRIGSGRRRRQVLVHNG